MLFVANSCASHCSSTADTFYYALGRPMLPCVSAIIATEILLIKCILITCLIHLSATLCSNEYEALEITDGMCVENLMPSYVIMLSGSAVTWRSERRFRLSL